MDIKSAFKRDKALEPKVYQGKSGQWVVTLWLDHRADAESWQPYLRDVIAQQAAQQMEAS